MMDLYEFRPSLRMVYREWKQSKNGEKECCSRKNEEERHNSLGLIERREITHFSYIIESNL